MNKKTCFKCNTEQDISEFYTHSMMADGHLNKCKSCTKSDVKKHREQNLEKIRAYDAVRYRTNPSRSYKLRKKYDNSKARALWSRNNKEKISAHRAIARAIKRGEIIRPSICSRCGSHTESGAVIEAHHNDYSKPLLVEWLCTRCHGFAHSKPILEYGACK